MSVSTRSGRAGAAVVTDPPPRRLVVVRADSSPRPEGYDMSAAPWLLLLTVSAAILSKEAI